MNAAPEKIEIVQWVEKVQRLDDLKPFENNPRTITEAQYERLKNSLISVGYAARIEATHDLRVIGGHQRLRVLRELGVKEVAVIVPPRPLSDEEFKRQVLASNHNNGMWDEDMLANFFDMETIEAVGLHDFMTLAKEVKEAENPTPPKSNVKCPHCGEVFPVKGNKATDEQKGAFS